MVLVIGVYATEDWIQRHMTENWRGGYDGLNKTAVYLSWKGNLEAGGQFASRAQPWEDSSRARAPLYSLLCHFEGVVLSL